MNVVIESARLTPETKEKKTNRTDSSYLCGILVRAVNKVKTGNNVDTSHLPITSIVDSMDEVFFFFPIREMQTRINKPGRAMRFVPRRFCLMVTDIRTYIRTDIRTNKQTLL